MSKQQKEEVVSQAVFFILSIAMAALSFGALRIICIIMILFFGIMLVSTIFEIMKERK